MIKKQQKTRISADIGTALPERLEGMAKGLNRDLDYMDVKMMSEIVARLRGQARQAVRRARQARAVVTQQRRYDIAHFYAHVEAKMAYEAASEHVRLWYVAHRDYFIMHDRYLQQCATQEFAQRWLKAA